jgi:hypothetical protein
MKVFKTGRFIRRKIDLLENGEFITDFIETDGKFIYVYGVWITPEFEEKQAVITTPMEYGLLRSLKKNKPLLLSHQKLTLQIY